jgi:MFS family permease
MIFIMVIISLIGMIMVYAIENTKPYSRLARIWMAAVFAADIPISLSLITSNVGGFTKKAMVSAILFIGYSVGNIIGPQFFWASEISRYPVRIPVLQLLQYSNHF